MQLKQILIDLDDVLNLFTMAALRNIGCPVEPADYHLYDPDWGYDIVRAANELHPVEGYLPKEEFFRILTDYFWQNIPVSDMMLPLLEACRNVIGEERMCILTAPVGYPNTAASKVVWMNEHLPFWMRGRYIISEHKHFCAHPGALLIDDCEENVNTFREHEGLAILVPRPWNSLYASTSHALQYVLLELERML